MSYSTDSELIRNLTRHDPEDRTWEMFLAKYEPLIYRWSLRWGVHGMDADEIVQETMLNLFRYIDTYRKKPEIRFRAWLKTIAYHCWLRMMKAKRAVLDADRVDADNLASIPCRSDLVNVFERIADQEIFDIACRNVRSKSSERSWKCFRMVHIDQLPTNEVAMRLNMTENAVYLTTSRIMRSLRQEIEAIDPE